MRDYIKTKFVTAKLRSENVVCPKHKRCINCHEDKEISCFSKAGNFADGRYSECKECRNKKFRAKSEQRRIDNSFLNGCLPI